jgi:hypothetical protein
MTSLKSFKAVQPLIDANVVCLYPAITCYRKWTAIELFGEVRNFSVREMEGASPDLYIAEGLSYARIFDASYTALSRTEHQALERAADSLDDAIVRPLGLRDRKTLVTLPQITLLSFQYLDAQSLVSVRGNEASFEDFRSSCVG